MQSAPTADKGGEGGDEHGQEHRRGSRVGAVKSRSEFSHNGQWFKRDTTTGRILNGSPNQHKGVRNEKKS